MFRIRNNGSGLQIINIYLRIIYLFYQWSIQKWNVTDSPMFRWTRPSLKQNSVFSFEV